MSSVFIVPMTIAISASPTVCNAANSDSDGTRKKYSIVAHVTTANAAKVANTVRWTPRDDRATDVAAAANTAKQAIDRRSITVG